MGFVLDVTISIARLKRLKFHYDFHMEERRGRGILVTHFITVVKFHRTLTVDLVLT